PQRCRAAQDVVALVRIEVTNLIAQNRLVVSEKRGTAGAVVDHIERTAKIHVPHERQIVVREVLSGEEERRSRQQLHVRGWRLFVVTGCLRGCRVGPQHDRQRHEGALGESSVLFHSGDLSVDSAPAERNRAMRVSSASMRRLSSGRRLKSTDALRQSRLSIAGYPATMARGSSELVTPDCPTATAPRPIVR